MNQIDTSSKKLKRNYRSGHSTMTRKSMQKWAWLFVGPVLAAFIIGFVWPFLQGVYLSFNNFKIISNPTFVGFENYVKAFSDKIFSMHSGSQHCLHWSALY